MKVLQKIESHARRFGKSHAAGMVIHLSQAGDTYLKHMGMEGAYHYGFYEQMVDL